METSFVIKIFFMGNPLLSLFIEIKSPNFGVRRAGTDSSSENYGIVRELLLGQAKELVK